MILATAQRATASVINTLLPYNGVVEEGLMQCIHRENEDSVSRPLTNNMKATGTGKDKHRASRPTDLGRITTLSNGFSSRFSGSSQAGGSQASSPESSLDLDSLPESSINNSHELLENDTRNLVDVFFRSYNGLKHPQCSKPKALATMDRVVKSLVVKHEIVYKGMINKLNFDERGDDMSFISTVAKEMFSDGKTNWGRIASLLAFGAVLCSHLKTRGQEGSIDQVGNRISSYLLSDQQEWLINNKEWDGFVEFFHEHDPESIVRGALMTIAGVAGIGAGLAFLIR
ncbi:induced myeloid leukemia cell differentiation protein Mcl-1b [Alosa pseudoharengus]|uniref:induced myeloid leukemia cell differentiation protein Mcl-1b n=1 Tax=Alosa pseudoharengus TaxID=34774 RepID=UPI003F898A15